MKFEIRDAAGGQFYWRIVAANGERLAHSENYVRKEDCQRTVESVRRYAGNAPVVDQTAARRAAAALNQAFRRR